MSAELVEACLELGTREAERWSDALIDAGALSVDLADAALGTAWERPIFDEPGARDDAQWERCTLRALFADLASAQAAVSSVAAAVGAIHPCRFEPVAERDWVRLTQSQFQPIAIEGRLWIVPTWSEVPQAPGAVLRLDPGRAFGTGSHPTTRLCLAWLASHLPPGAAVLDYGCGSGILALAALKLGAGSATAVDVDAQAIAACGENAALNGLRLRAGPPEIVADERFTVLVANILAKPLILLAPVLASHVADQGDLLLSGVLESQAEAVARAYEPWFTLTAWRRDEDWIALHGRRITA